MQKILCKIENLFLVICLFWGLVLLITNPPFQAPDEFAHFFKMWGYTQGTLRYQIKDGWTGIKISKNMKEIYYAYAKHVYSSEKIPLYKTITYSKLPLEKQEQHFVKIDPSSYLPISYFPSFIVLWLLKLFNVKPLCMMYILRFCSLLVYLSLMYGAIKITPTHKWLFLIFALLPINVYQAASISTDGITYGAIGIFIALTLKLASDGTITKLNKFHIFVWIFLITCIGLLKFAYFPLILLYFLIPTKKFKDKKTYYTNFLLTLAINIVIIIAFLLFSMHKPGMTEHVYNNQLLPSYEMIKKILSSPLQYIKLVISSTWYLKNFFFYNTISSVGGNLVMLPPFLLNLTWFILFVSAFCNKTNKEITALNFKNKELIVISIILSYLLIVTAIYIIYQTQPYITGIQGRYLTPFILLFLLLFDSKKGYISNKIIPILLTLISQVLLLLTTIIIFMYYY